MKRKKIMLPVCCALAALLLYWALIPLDPYHMAPNGIPFFLGSTICRFYDGQRAKSIVSISEMVPYSHEDAFAKGRDYCLLKILDIRDIHVTQIYYYNKALDFISDPHSLVKAEILSVYHDNEEWQPGDVVTLYSYAPRNYSNRYVPGLEEGASYYVRLHKQEITEKSSPEQRAMDKIIDGYMHTSCYGIMPVRSDGMVEYYYEIMPDGTREPYDPSVKGIWAELPQDEFEAGFRELIARYGLDPETSE